MPKKKLCLLFSCSLLCLVACLAIIVYQRHLLRTANDRWEQAQGSMEVLSEKSKEATVVRRTSEQLEEIAYQQKTISDIQRREAVLQSQIASRQTLIAQQETRNANLARSQAEEAFVQMEEQKELADRRRVEAVEAQMKTDTLARLALGRSLSSQGATLAKTGNQALAALLTFSGWRFTLENNGDVYQGAVFNALNQVSGSTGSYTGHSGYIRDLVVDSPADGALAFYSASQDGELFYWTVPDNGEQASFRALVSDPQYDFRQLVLLPLGKGVLAFTYDGRAVCVEGRESATVQVFPTSVTQVIGAALWNGTLYLASRDGCYRLDHCMERIGEGPKKNTYWSFDCLYKSESPLTAVLFDESRIVAGTALGDRLEMGYDGTLVRTAEKTSATEYLTSARYNPSGDLACGFSDGTVLVEYRAGRTTRLPGHLSSVNAIVWSGTGLVTASSDGSLRYWNLSDPAAESLVVQQSPSWIYSAVPVDNGNAVLAGGASRTLYKVPTSPYVMARAVERQLTREFTQAEWDYYVGEVAPYRTFKK